MSRVSSLAKSLRELRLEHQEILEKKSMFDHDVNRALNALAKFDSIVKKSNTQEIRSAAKDDTQSFPPPPSEESSEEVAESQESEQSQKDIPGWAKKTYRKIVLKTHPDKVMQDVTTTDAQKDRLILLYREATESYQNSKYDTLAEVAAELDIEVEIPDQEMERALETKIKSLREEMKKIMKSVSWVWGTSFGDIELRIRVLVKCCELTKVMCPDRQILESIVRELESQPEFEIIDKLGSVRRIRAGVDRRKVGTRPEKLIKRN